jgi:hypothetical protein
MQTTFFVKRVINTNIVFNYSIHTFVAKVLPSYQRNVDEVSEKLSLKIVEMCICWQGKDDWIVRGRNS